MAQRPRQSRNDGLRQLLIDDYDRHVLGRYRRFANPDPHDHVAQQWARVPGAGIPPKEVVEEFEALKSGARVEFPSDRLFRVFFDAGLPVERFCHGGPDAEKWWALTERDELIELPD
jgi:hypothetical protein